MDMLRVWECRGGRGCVEDVWLVWREEEMMMRMRMMTMTCMDMDTKIIVKICRRVSIGEGQAGRLLPLLSSRASVLQIINSSVSYLSYKNGALRCRTQRNRRGKLINDE